jgi:hypothetical protein
MSELRVLAATETESQSTTPHAVVLTLAVQDARLARRVARDRAASLVGVKGSVARPSAGRLPPADARDRAVNVPPSRPELIAVPRRFAPRGSRGMASVEAQIMAGCPVIYYDDGEPPVLRLLRWSAEALALWLSGMCGPARPATPSQIRACAAVAMARQTPGLEVGEIILMFHGLPTSRHLDFIGKMMM